MRHGGFVIHPQPTAKARLWRADAFFSSPRSSGERVARRSFSEGGMGEGPVRSWTKALTRLAALGTLSPLKRGEGTRRARLRLKRQAAHREHVVLGHGGLRAVAHVRCETIEVAQGLLAAIDVARAAMIGHEQVIGAGAAFDVEIFAQLDISVGAEDREAPVAPARQPVGREPVDPHVTAGALAAQQDLAEIFEVGKVRSAELADRAGDDLGVLGTRVEHELLDLM